MRCRVPLFLDARISYLLLVGLHYLKLVGQKVFMHAHLPSLMKKEDILIVSDLHLCEGDASPNEDFFYDKEFSHFLDHFGAAKTLLIINGDFIDFLQVTSKGGFSDLTDNERRFGLGTEENKSVFKLRAVFHAHKRFFAALARFVSQGNRVVILPGNHDMEFFWPRVRETFFEELERIKKIPAIRSRIQFLPWFYYEPGFLYVDHGCQYDPINSYDNFLYPLLPNNPRQLDLPFGSFLVRYLFNLIEKTDPLADNFKPPIKYINVALQRDPLHVAQTISRYVPALLRIWVKSVSSQNPSEQHRIEQENNRRLVALAKQHQIPLSTISQLVSLWSRSLLH
ncbi:hypothetical protein GF342_05660, partial [Candidatus Woesearchaeota archaeon]|nr:hypothetical protein [Candidatus Woesearchaeota archaeon]